MLIVWFFVYKKLAQFAVRCALPPRRSESPGCAADNKPSCVLHLLGSFIGSRGFSSLEQRPEFWVLHHNVIQKNLDKLFGQPNIIVIKVLFSYNSIIHCGFFFFRPSKMLQSSPVLYSIVASIIRSPLPSMNYEGCRPYQ